METSASCEARSAPSPYPTSSSDGSGLRVVRDLLVRLRARERLRLFEPLLERADRLAEALAQLGKSTWPEDNEDDDQHHEQVQRLKEPLKHDALLRRVPEPPENGAIDVPDARVGARRDPGRTVAGRRTMRRFVPRSAYRRLARCTPDRGRRQRRG